MKGIILTFLTTLTALGLEYKGQERRAVYDPKENYIGCQVFFTLVHRFSTFVQSMPEEDCQAIGARNEDNITVPYCIFFENWVPQNKAEVPSCVKKKRKES